jgi:hypothetical protein
VTVAAVTDSAELLHELRNLSARLPVPQPSWHPYVPLILTLRKDCERAVELAAERPGTLELYAALVEGEAELAFEPGASPELAAAWKRLRALPIPEGEHPYLDEILPALDALRVLLVALSHTGAV